MSRETQLRELLNRLQLLHYDLYPLIIQYEKTIEWDPDFVKTFTLNNESPYGIICSSNHLYVCVCYPQIQSNVSMWTLNGKFIKNTKSVSSLAAAIDIDTKANLLYVVSQKYVTILNLELVKRSAWKLPVYSALYLRGIKVDNTIVYITVRGYNQIYICEANTGKLLFKYGQKDPETDSEKIGEFMDPLGLTINTDSLFICDYGNHRIQILGKNTGKYQRQWGGKQSKEIGKFSNPISIYRDIENEIYYVGDQFSIQLFGQNGVCIQRFGEVTEIFTMKKGLNGVYGISIGNGELFVSDSNRDRIQVFRHHLEDKPVKNRFSLSLPQNTKEINF